MAKGHITQVANDGPEALRVAAVFRPEIVLLDIGLPGMDGYEVARRLREVQPPLRLIALTGYNEEADFDRTADAGFDAYLVKPVALDKLFAVLR